MNRTEWTGRNKGECRIPSTRKKKNKDDFNPNSDFIKKAMEDFAKSGGKIKIPVETS
ncbi:hypothetical protein KAR91_12425 [Candidatus Pacearchaeota archaeon]|nr:hypothetical protein [Candidatus Pacearchaeota archaeon]